MRSLQPTSPSSTAAPAPTLGAPVPIAAKPVDVRPSTRLSGAKASKGAKAVAKKPFPVKDLIKFYRGMASMLRAQINTGDALKYYAHGLPNKDLAATLLKIQADIASGMTVHDAFRRSDRFDSMTVGLLHAGSDSGQLHQAFKALADRMKSDAHFRSKVRKAVAVPSIVISMLIFAFIMSQIRIVPQVEGMLKQVKQTPDAFTGIMFSISHVTQKVWPIVILGMIATAITIWKSVKARNFLLALGMSKWRLLRQLVMGLRQLTFLGTLHMLHSNGINLAKAIRTAAESIRTTPLYPELQTAADRYQHSALPVSDAFRKFTSCDEQIGHMLGIGERTASIDTQLALLAQMYEEDTENFMEEFTQVVNFVVLIIAVLLIAAVFIGTFLPIFLMGPKMMKGTI
jgi:type II secretory pathway component PulF